MSSRLSRQRTRQAHLQLDWWAFRTKSVLMMCPATGILKYGGWWCVEVSYLDKSVQLLVSSDGQLQVTGGDTLHLQILWGVTCQLKNLKEAKTKSFCISHCWLISTILQSKMNAKLGQQKFWPCHENRLIRMISTIPQNRCERFKSGYFSKSKKQDCLK